MANNSAAHTALVKSALEQLAIHGITAWKHNVGAYKAESGSWVEYGKPGHGDITIVLAPYGLHVEAEAKTGKGSQRKVQKDHQLYCVERNGGKYIIFRNVDELLIALTLLTPKGFSI